MTEVHTVRSSPENTNDSLLNGKKKGGDGELEEVSEHDSVLQVWEFKNLYRFKKQWGHK